MMNEGKTCIICGETKPLDEFIYRTAWRQYKNSDKWRTRKCKKCYSKWMTMKYNQNPINVWAYYSLYNHKKDGFTILLTRNELIEMAQKTKFCQLCGNELIYRYGRGLDRSKDCKNPSVDRINNDKILTKDNTMIICYRCNTAKSQMSLTEFVTYCKTVTRNFENHAIGHSTV